MSKKTHLIGITCILGFSIILFPSVNYSAQYYDQYPGNCFQQKNWSTAYGKHEDGCIYHDEGTNAFYFCPVNFKVPDGSTYFIKSIGMRYYDQLADAYLKVELKRLNLYTGNCHTVASWTSGKTAASAAFQTASHGTISGRKLVDTKKFAYFLIIYFYRDGILAPSMNLRLYQVRIHYGT